ncbi:single-stranded DNA-binding protein [Levilactobacillus zymae]|uniref:Single-stranded DNA-binding protein n=1 Tax=Levilactobacillus zymae TaxID=267363 RepID=A0ABQ0X763_9LACO|nr:single-stranded DNA-binding protein [Levilactobacillus zymae]QFR61038.1 single-stranded DNA-binding protein [Levilactobacillus zymae]GEO73203.1 single-stranded DNA-binding protein [Levilactobacillus zymae]
MINRVVLTGRLTRDVDLRYTQSGDAVGTFNLAVDRRFKNQQGEREADFVQCVIWRKSAENFANFFHKGSLVGIEGRIQTRNYENQQGNRVYVTEVIVENFSFLESGNRNNSTGTYGNDSKSSTTTSGQSTTGNDPFANTGDSIDVNDNDLPF